MSSIYNFPDQGDMDAADLLTPTGSEGNPAVKAKLHELQTWTLSYNHEMLRIARELNQLRSNEAKAA